METRVDRIEMALERLAREVEETSRTVRLLSLEMHAFKDEMRAFKDEMRAFKDEMRAFKDEMLAFKDEMVAFKDEMRDFKDEMRAFKGEMNKRWGDLANRLGTLVEDIVAPALPEVVKRRFNLELEDMMVRRKRRRGELREEFDVIGVVEDKLFVVEVKSQYKTEYVDQFSEKLTRFRALFPEYEDRRLIGVVASLYLDEGVVRYATAKGYYAMGMKGDYMDFLNVEELPIEP